MKLKNDDFSTGSGVQPNVPNNSGNDAFFEQFNSDNIIPEFKQGYEQTGSKQDDLYAEPVFMTDSVSGGNKKFNLKDALLKGGGGSAARPNWTAFLYIGLFIIIFVWFFNSVTGLFRAKHIINEGYTTNAIVTDYRSHHSRSGSSYSVYVSYEVNGVDYQNILLKSSHSYPKLGDVVTIYYDKDIPNHITYSKGPSDKIFSSCMLLVLLGVIGYIVYVSLTDPERAARMLSRRGWRRRRF